MSREPKRVRIDSFKEAFIDKLPVPEEPKAPTVYVDKDLSIDSELSYGLYAIHKIMQSVLVEAGSGTPSRESVQNLKDCMSMLHELKEQEADILEELSDDELESIANKKE